MTIIDKPVDPPIPALEATGELIRAPFDGGHVAWHRFGHGTPLVLLHGGHGSWLHWVRNIEALAARHEVWVPDLPGYGDSDMPAEMRFDALVDALLASLATQLPADRPIALAGFSFGGLVAASIASRRGHVGRLALFGAAGHGVARRPRGELLNWRDALDAGDLARLEALMRHNLLMHMLHDEAALDARALHIHVDACLHTRFRSRAISRAGGLFDALAGFQGPVLAAWGEHDVTVDPPLVVQKFAALRPDARTHVLAGAGHWAPYERAAAVDALLLDWLGRDGAGT